MPDNNIKLVVRLAKISPVHHSFEYVREDGKGAKVELETKTFLFHDFLHFAVASEAGLQNSFYGMLYSGKEYAALVPKGETGGVFLTGEAAVTERIVGPLTGVIKGETTTEQFLEGLENIFSAYGEAVPAWVTGDFVEKVKEKMRRLLGEWNHLPFGQAMEICFSPSS